MSSDLPVRAECLLDAPVVGVRRLGCEERLSLPGVLAALARNEVESFTALQRHQRHPWHAFLVQIAALVVHRTGAPVANQTTSSWRSALLALTAGSVDAWTLVVQDLSRPAFLQASIPEASISVLKNRILSPDEIDVLVLARNHDVKAGRIRSPLTDHWIYALVDLQTMSGFGGAGNYGVARMNGGFASRPGIGSTPSMDWGARFCRDVDVLIESREATVSSLGYQGVGGAALLWTIPWDGSTSMGLGECDPFFVEICRRVRLVVEGDRVVARSGTSSRARVAAKEFKGSTGDPWTPTWKEDGSALTVSSRGFSSDLLRELLFPEDQRPGAAQAVRVGDGAAPLLVATALVRGQGRTDGLHETAIPIPQRIARRLIVESERVTLGGMAKRRVAKAAEAKLKVLKPALLTYVQGAPDELSWSDDSADASMLAFDAKVDACFFEDLWAAADMAVSDADDAWAYRLTALAEQTFRRAIRSLPTPDARRWRAITTAERVFRGACRRVLPLREDVTYSIGGEAHAGR